MRCTQFILLSLTPKKENCMSQNTVTLCWYPPAKTYLPSPAMTVLKKSLQEVGIDVQIVYWNILLEDILLRYFFNEKKSLDDDIASLGIFFAYIAIERNDTEALIKQELYLRALKPQYTINNFDFQKHIRDCVHDLKSVVSKICIDYNIKNSLFVGMSMSLFQWIPAYVVGSILKELNPNLFITVGGIGNPEQAQAFIRSFKYINLASWGEGEFFFIDLAKRLLSGKDLDTLSQCYFRKGNAIVKSSILKKEYKDLDKLAYNDFSDFFNVYKGKHKDIMFPIEGARGCHWNRCHFCFLNQGYKYRHKSADIIKEEILNNIKEYSVYDYTFLDNDVIGKDREKFNILLDNLIEIKKYYPKFRVMLAEIITRGINFETIKKMHLAGFIHVQIGYESPSDVLLSKIDNKNTFASNLFFIKWANEFNIHVGGMNVLRGLIEENIEDVKEGVQNLHFMRFFHLGTKYKHEISSLAINNASRYYKNVNKSELDSMYSDSVKEMLPKNFLAFEDSLSIYQFVRKFQLHAWDYFESIETHYAKNSYSYKLVRISDQKVRYTEFYNSASVRIIDFDESDIAWKILRITDASIVPIDKLSDLLECPKDLVQTEINKLRDVGLLYVGKQSKECVSIIKTFNIL